MYFNYHTHTDYCDGKDRPEDFVKRAIKLGFKALGFSAHAPLPFENNWTLKDENLIPYCDEINRLKALYRDQIEIYHGLEIDFIPGLLAPSDEKFKSLHLDYVIGSVHSILDPGDGKYYSVDGTDEEFRRLYEHVFQRDMKAMVLYYFELMAHLLEDRHLDIIGHMDLIKKKNRNSRYFREDAPWYFDIIINFLDKVQGSGYIVEVNTGGMARGATDDVYPSRWIIRECKSRDIPILLNADAHSIDHLSFYFDQSLEIMRKAGYTDQRVLFGGRWQDIPL